MKQLATCAVMSALIWSSAAFAVDAERLSVLGRLNRHIVAEGAGSHGSWGVYSGASISALALSPDEAATWKAATQAPTDLRSASSQSISQFQLIKGTPWPVDVGLSIGMPGDGQGRRLGGHLQWTIYEALAMPAVALRASHSRLTTNTGSQAISNGLEILTSVGALRYLQIYGGIAGYANTATVKEAPMEQTALTSIHARPLDASGEWKDWSASAGLQIRIFSPFFYLAVEDRLDNGERQTITTKASLVL